MYRVDERRCPAKSRNGMVVKEFDWKRVCEYRHVEAAELVAKMINSGQMPFEARVIPLRQEKVFS